MLTTFYRRYTHISQAIIIGAITTFLALILLLNFYHISTSILPNADSRFTWQIEAVTDQTLPDGRSVMDIKEAHTAVTFSYTLNEGFQTPFVSATLDFEYESAPEPYIDLSSYSSISFKSRCESATEGVFSFHVYDQELIDKPHVVPNYRVPGATFSCLTHWQLHHIDFSELIIPEWWFSKNNLDGGKKDFDLETVMAVSFFLWQEENLPLESKAEFIDVVLHGRNSPLLTIVLTIIISVWIGLLLWVTSSYFQKKRVLSAHKLLLMKR